MRYTNCYRFFEPAELCHGDWGYVPRAIREHGPYLFRATRRRTIHASRKLEIAA